MPYSEHSNGIEMSFVIFFSFRWDLRNHLVVLATNEICAFV